MFSMLKTKGLLVLDLQPYCEYLSETIGQVLADPPNGLYHPSSVEPLLIEGEHYRDSEGNVFVFNGLSVISPVYSLGGLPLVTSKYIKDGKLSAMPYHHYVERAVILAAIFETIDGSVMHEYTNTIDIESLFKQDRDVVIDYVHKVVGELITKVRQFIGDDEYSIYNVEGNHNYQLYISRKEDYRIYEWYEFKKSEKHITAEITISSGFR
jgi:hypothetical protein